MSEPSRELGELKREVVEARNQAIKTDNQIKNLTLDIKGFEKRFDGLEGRVRLSSIGVNLIVAVTIALSGYLVYAMRVRVYETEIVALKEAVREESLLARGKSDELVSKVEALERGRQASDEAAQAALRLLDLLDARRDKEAANMLGTLELTHLTQLERKVLQPRLDELRHRQAEIAYRQGRRAVAEGHPDQAVPDLRRAVQLEADGQYAGQARYQLAWALWQLQRWADVEPLARELMRNPDRQVTLEGRYMLATTLVRLGRRDEARLLLDQMAAQEGRFAGAARAYLQAMASGSPLPVDLPGGRVRLARRGPGGPRAQAAAVAEDAAPAAPAPAP